MNKRIACLQKLRRKAFCDYDCSGLLSPLLMLIGMLRLSDEEDDDSLRGLIYDPSHLYASTERDSLSLSLTHSVPVNIHNNLVIF